MITPCAIPRCEQPAVRLTHWGGCDLWFCAYHAGVRTQPAEVRAYLAERKAS